MLTNLTQQNEVFMAIKFYGGSIESCGTGVIAPKEVDVEFHEGFKMKNCGAGVALYATAEELKILQEKSGEYFQELKELAEKLAATQPDQRKAVLTASTVFAALAVGSNAATVMQFLIEHFPTFAQLLQ